MELAFELLAVRRPKANLVAVFAIVTRYGESHLDRGLWTLLAHGNNALPPEFVACRFTLINQEVAQEPDRLRQVGFPGPATADEHRDGVKLKIEFTDTLEVAYFNPFDHKIGKRVVY